MIKPKRHPFCLFCGASLVNPQTGKKISKTAFCSIPEHRQLWRVKYKSDWFQKNKDRLRVRLRYNRQKKKELLTNQQQNNETENQKTETTEIST